MFQVNFAADDAFYDAVLESYTRHSVFIVVNVESDEYEGKAIIQNLHLFRYLRQSKGFDKEQYKSFMKDLLSNNFKLPLAKGELSNDNSFALTDNLCANSQPTSFSFYALRISLYALTFSLWLNSQMLDFP